MKTVNVPIKPKELSNCCNYNVITLTGTKGEISYICDKCHCDCNVIGKPKELDWEKEFDNKYKRFCLRETYGFEKEQYEHLKNEINALLTQQRTEIENYWLHQKANDHDNRIREDERTELLEEIKGLDFTAILEAVYDNGTLDIKPISGFLKETVLKQGNMYIKEDITNLLNKK